MSFVVLHVLNLVTTLTPATVLARHSAQHPHYGFGEVLPGGSRKVDITASSVSSALSALAAAHSDLDLTYNQTELTEPVEIELLVRISPPLYVRVIPSDAPARHSGDNSLTRFTHDLLDNFMSSWTGLVGDPVISKCIVV